MEEISEDFEINISYNKKEQTLFLHSFKSRHAKIIECKNKTQFEKILKIFLGYTIPYKGKEQKKELEKENKL